MSGRVSLVTVADYEHQRMVEGGSQGPDDYVMENGINLWERNNREISVNSPYNLVELAWVPQKCVWKVLQSSIDVKLVWLNWMPSQFH